jgi:hypothetical protein
MGLRSLLAGFPDPRRSATVAETLGDGGSEALGPSGPERSTAADPKADRRLA